MTVPERSSLAAPSPTGRQHVGNARTYLIAWLSRASPRRPGAAAHRGHRLAARQARGGRAGRATTCAGSGLDWDGGPVVQTRRLPLYEAALERLQAAGAGLPLHLHARRRRAGRQRPARRARGAGLPRHLRRPPRGRRRGAGATGRSPGASACRPTSPAFDGRLPRPTRRSTCGRLGGDFVVWKSARDAGVPARGGGG